MSIITIFPINQTYIKVKCLEDEGVNFELHDYFTFKVPGYQFMKAYKIGRWDGSIKLYHLSSNIIYKGLIPQIRQFCEERGHSLEFHPLFSDTYKHQNPQITKEIAKIFTQKLNLSVNNEKIEPHGFQLAALMKVINEKQSLILSPTGSGKSLINYLIIRWIQFINPNSKILIIVPTTSLVEQLYSDFQDYASNDSWLVNKNCHKIYQGKDKSSKLPIYISTWQSLIRLPDEWFHQFDGFIVDEAHGAKASCIKKILENSINAEYRIGTTGTLDGTKTHSLVLQGLNGPIFKAASASDLIEDGILSGLEIKCLVLQYSEELGKLIKEVAYQEELDYIISNEKRNNFIANLAGSLEGNTLVLFEYLDHGKTIYKKIVDKNPTQITYYVDGETPVEEKEKTRKLIDTHEKSITVTSKVFGVGINIKKIHNIILCSPRKSKIQILQAIGRGLRKKDTKLQVYDIADDMHFKKHVNTTMKHFLERVNIYASEKYPFKIFKIRLG